MRFPQSALAILVCCAAVTQVAASNAASLTSAELAGCYRRENNVGWSSLRLSPDGTYTVYTTVGLGILAKATGGWEFEDGELAIGPSNETDGWLFHATPISIDRSNGNLVLISTSGEFIRSPLMDVAPNNSFKPNRFAGRLYSGAYPRL